MTERQCARRIRLDAGEQLFRLAFAARRGTGLGRRLVICSSCTSSGCVGVAPTYISVGGLDLFLEENLTYADRLSRAGVPVELHMYPRAYHGFYRATNARVTKQAEHDTREALRRFLHG
jgi:alpha/beta hydrolase fold